MRKIDKLNSDKLKKLMDEYVSVYPNQIFIYDYNYAFNRNYLWIISLVSIVIVTLSLFIGLELFVFLSIVDVIFLITMYGMRYNVGQKLEKYYKELQTSEKNQRKVEKALEEEGFIISSKVIFEWRNTFNGLYIDDKHKRFAMTSRHDDSSIIYSFDQLLDFSVTEDGNSLISSNAGNALLGGILFGTTGAIIGSQSERTIDKKCDSLKINLVLNDLEYPSFVFNFIDSSVDRESYHYKKATNSINQFIASLSYISHNSSKKEVKTKKEKTVDDKNSKDKLKELKEMLDNDLITKKEYDKLKKEILNNFAKN